MNDGSGVAGMILVGVLGRSISGLGGLGMGIFDLLVQILAWFGLNCF